MITGLVGGQILGGVGLASGIAVMALLTRDLAGSEALAGLGTTFQVLGGALIAIPVSQLMAARGRRPGLLFALALAIVGALAVIVASVIGSLPLMLLGSLLFGGATTASSQARFAGADLASAQHRGRDLSIVVWATTLGSVAGPNLVGPAAVVASALGLPALAGSFVFSLIGFVTAVVVLAVLLRPDPLLVARSLQPEPASTMKPRRGDGFRVIARRPAALSGLLTMSIGHVVMVSAMIMTPLHMDHGGASLKLIGFVVSMHILGMYAFSPVTGIAVDRLGSRLVGAAGAVVLLLACGLAATSPEGMSGHLTLALFLLGIGWSCTLVAGSTLLTAALTVAERPRAQGVADLVMGLTAAAGGALAGVVLERASYAALAWGCAVLAILLVVALAVTSGRFGARPEVGSAKI